MVCKYTLFAYVTVWYKLASDRICGSLGDGMFDIAIAPYLNCVYSRNPKDNSARSTPRTTAEQVRCARYITSHMLFCIIRYLLANDVYIFIKFIIRKIYAFYWKHLKYIATGFCIGILKFVWRYLPKIGSRCAGKIGELLVLNCNILVKCLGINHFFKFTERVYLNGLIVTGLIWLFQTEQCDILD